MPLWNLASPDHTIALNIDAFDSQPHDGAIKGTLTYHGTLFQVSGQWSASGNARKASAFSLVGSSGEEPPTFVAASGIMIGPGNAPAQIDFRLGFSSSGDGEVDHYSGVLVPAITVIGGFSHKPYQSGEMMALTLTASTPPAVTIFDNHIYLLTDNTISTFDLKNIIPNPNNGDNDEINANSMNGPWTSQDLSQVAYWPQDNLSKCSLAATTENVFMFINSRYLDGSGNQVVAWKLSRDDGWDKNRIDLTTGPAPSGVLVQPGPGIKGDYKADVSTTVFGGNIVFMAVAQAKDESGKQQGTFLAIYDTRHLGDNAWRPNWHRFLPMNGNVVDNVTIEWFSTIGSDGQPEFYLIVYASASGTSQTLVWYIPLTVTQDDQGGTVVVPAEPTAPRNMQPQYGAGDVIQALVRDPAGRVRGWGTIPGASSGFVFGHIFGNLEPPAVDGSPVCPGVNEKLVASDTLTGPSSLFYVFTQGQSQTTFNGKRATDFPVYEFIFYGKTLKIQVNRYGTIEHINKFRKGSPTIDPTKVKNIISGIIDSPIPLPLENYAQYNLGETEKVAGNLVYGSSDINTSSHAVTNKWTAGFKSSGKATEGVGIAWDISFDAGMGSVTERTQESTISSALNISAKLSQDQAFTPVSINLNGTLQTAGAEFTIDAYRFLDPVGNVVMDATTSDSGQSPKAAAVLLTMSSSGSMSYLPYAVIPGNLSSYTPEALNKRMYQLAHPDDKDKQTDFPNYYGEVIYANAYPFTEDKPYLEYSWSEDSQTVQEYTQFKSAYTENSWTYDGEGYVGISFGGGVSIFGLGEEQEAEMLFGASYSSETTETAIKESEWGISLDSDWGPPARENISHTVTRYAFRLFFLPVPKSPSKLSANHWVQELCNYMPEGSDTPAAAIDQNSGCWRIVFVVTDIQFKDGVGSYQYFNNYLDTNSVYEA